MQDFVYKIAQFLHFLYIYAFLKNVKIADAYKKVGKNGTEMGSKMRGFFPFIFLAFLKVVPC